MNKYLFYYRANVIAVYDGDTITVDIDLGLKTWVKAEKIRLARINTPEVRGPEKEQGKISRDFLRGLILNQTIYLQTLRDKKGKYGRYLGEVWIEQDGQLINVNDLLVEKGLAIYKEY